MKKILLILFLINLCQAQWAETFSDFTGHLNDSLKAKWVFGSGYASDKGTIDYIGQDWSQGGAIVGSNNIHYPECGNTGNSWQWAATSAVSTDAAYSGNNSIKVTLIGSSCAAGQLLKDSANNTLLEIGKFYRASIWINHGTATFNAINIKRTTGINNQAFLIDVEQVGDWHHYEAYFVATDSSTLQVYYIHFFGTGTYFYYDLCEIQELSNDNHLTASASFDYASQLTGTSPIYENDNALAFDGLNDYWYIPAGQDSDFEIGAMDDITIMAWVKVSDLSHTNYIISNYDGTQGWNFYVLSSGAVRFFIKDGVNYVLVESTAGSVVQNTWVYIAASIDHSANVQIYIDAVASGLPQSISSIDGYTDTADFLIGKYSTTLFKGEIASVTYHAKALTADEIKEQYALEYNLYSNNANVLRENVTDWFQGSYADTLTMSTGIVGNCKMKFNAWGQSGGEVLEVWSGTTKQLFTLTDTKAAYSASLQMADGLCFASTDTFYIDDIESAGGRKGYLQYLQYLDYIGSGNCKEGKGSFPYYFPIFFKE